MSNLTNGLLNLVQELRIITDPDESRTAQNLTPIMGSDLTLEQVNLVARFLTSWNFEDVNFDDPKGVYLTGNGLKIPLSAFTCLGALGPIIGADGLRKLGLLLQHAPADFWQAHLPQRSKSLGVLIDAVARFVHDAIDLADRLYDDREGGMTFMDIGEACLSLQPSGSER